MNDIEVRRAATVEVRYAQRIIDIIAVPYNETIEVLRRGRWVTESVMPGAFAGVSSDIKVNRAHNPEEPLGRVAKWHPGDPRGLRAELKMTQGVVSSDEALALAEDGLLSASVGFRPLAEEWNSDRTAVKVTRAELVHIALTGDPAYPGAKVLAVRDNPGDAPRALTPNLDRLRLEMLARRHGMQLPSIS